MADFPEYPIVNGTETSYCSIDFTIGPGVRLVGVKSINYKSPGEIPMVRGLSPVDIGRTRGKVTHEGDIEILRREWKKLLPILTQGGRVGYMETVIPAVAITYSEPSEPDQTTTDTLAYVRIHSPDRSYSEGTDALTVKLTLSIMGVFEDGVFVALRTNLPGRALGG